jgi:hypothetical protein
LKSEEVEYANMPYLYQDKNYPTYVEQRGAELLYPDYIYKVKADPALRDPNDFPAKRLVNTLFEVRKQALDMMAQTGMDQNVLLQDKKKKQQQKEPKKKENQHQTKETSTEREEGHQAPKQKKRVPKKADRPTRKEEIIQINSHFKIKRTAETNDEEIKAAHQLSV